MWRGNIWGDKKPFENRKHFYTKMYFEPQATFLTECWRKYFRYRESNPGHLGESQIS